MSVGVDTLVHARQRAKRLYPKSRALQGSYMKGVKAALAGRPESACPYRVDARKTWRVAFRRAWLRGHQSESRSER